MKRLITLAALAASGQLAQAGSHNTADRAAVDGFQHGLTVLDFEAQPPGSTTAAPVAMPITRYASGLAVPPSAHLFDQSPGVKFSVGGTPGVNRPAVYRLEGSLARDAASGSNVLGGVDFDFNTRFDGSAFIEIYFPAKVSKVGFWLNGQLDFVTVIAANTNFAFSREDEFTLETGIGEAGKFFSIERDAADIGGLKILTRGAEGFTIDDFSYGSATPVPEPAAVAMLLAGLAGVLAACRRAGRSSRRPAVAGPRR
jgi:hypothetical protein